MLSSETAQPPPPDPSNIQPTTSLPPSTSASNQTNEVPVLNASPPNSSSLSPPSTLSPPPPSYTQATAPTVSDTSAPLIQPLSYPSALDLSPVPALNDPAPLSPATPNPNPTSPTAAALPPFSIKEIEFFGSPKTILLQNENGPCPLLALSNVLILRNVLRLPAQCVASSIISFDELVQLIGGLALDDKKSAADNLETLMDLLPTLAKGLDVNPKFCEGVTGYEYTDKIVAFDTFGVELVHGWLIDPSDPNHDMFEGLSYNQLVELVISSDSSGKVEEIVKGDAVRAFLDSSAHQLTYHGLTSLHTHLPSNSLSVFFRNNHFSTIFQHDSKMFLLVTDQGYSSVSEVVWEVLSNIDGDTSYVNSSFQKPSIQDDYTRSSSLQISLPDPDADLQAAISASLNLGGSSNPPLSSNPASVSVGVGTVVNLPGGPMSPVPLNPDSDMLIAQKLQREMNAPNIMSDAETARMIQQQEEYEYQQQQASARHRNIEKERERERKKKNDSSCSLM
ncbi:hypothetical protein TrVE_jg8346 [Triparma verrucosa]|uniref:MINDY deubiquitinase domain-containing protein n=1 Tax=Triparma verrucosa TaxID=1606542 RepID=A0A9W7F1V6_9STRA|nr:hypothetical protein TrVE_jg8346 [Triparma verrucosa]